MTSKPKRRARKRQRDRKPYFCRELSQMWLTCIPEEDRLCDAVTEAVEEGWAAPGPPAGWWQDFRDSQ